MLARPLCALYARSAAPSSTAQTGVVKCYYRCNLDDGAVNYRLIFVTTCDACLRGPHMPFHRVLVPSISINCLPIPIFQTPTMNSSTMNILIGILRNRKNLFFDENNIPSRNQRRQDALHSSKNSSRNNNATLRTCLLSGFALDNLIAMDYCAREI